MIPEEILLKHSAKVKSYAQKEVIITEGETARYYLQIKTGSVAMFNLHESGKEFIQGVFKKQQSFGEPAIFGDFEYPASARALEDSQLFLLPKENLTELLKTNFEINQKFLKRLSKRLSYKAMQLREISMHTPEHRILTLLDFLKENAGATEKYKINLTRQQLANLTGLRVETVIRACQQLAAQNEIEIINRKLYR
ncbi:Crp/Fnr family transcriptional regulator [Rasiella sp. SM2506]|uniref:Crp/Fnr family transcriptional regulator n=1 Tax=Rasiella sp. SM2506 TaxID=3423914 RepID=UPI003D78BD58